MDKLLEELVSRLPELEWKVNGLYSKLSNYNMPRGLFNAATEYRASSCIEEIKADIHSLSNQANERSALYLANRIKQKIHVLVTLCQIDHKKKPEKKVASTSAFNITTLSTRQQWIEVLEKDINILLKQQAALAKTLLKIETDCILNVQKELGEIERKITLAKEKLSQAVTKIF